MRLLLCLAFMLTACASHTVRCDKHLQPINQPTSARPAGADAPARSQS
jgi:hypothetical protein